MFWRAFDQDFVSTRLRTGAEAIRVPELGGSFDSVFACSWPDPSPLQRMSLPQLAVRMAWPRTAQIERCSDLPGQALCQTDVVARRQLEQALPGIGGQLK